MGIRWAKQRLNKYLIWQNISIVVVKSVAQSKNVNYAFETVPWRGKTWPWAFCIHISIAMTLIILMKMHFTMWPKKSKQQCHCQLYFQFESLCAANLYFPCSDSRIYKFNIIWISIKYIFWSKFAFSIRTKICYGWPKFWTEKYSIICKYGFCSHSLSLFSLSLIESWLHTHTTSLSANFMTNVRFQVHCILSNAPENQMQF